MGYPYGQKGWKIYDLETHEIFVSRDIIFYEDVFPFGKDDKAGIPVPQHGEKRSGLTFDDNKDFATLDCEIGTTP